MTKTETVTEEVIVRTICVEEEDEPTINDVREAIQKQIDEKRAKRAEKDPETPVNEQEPEQKEEDATPEKATHEKTDLAKAILDRKKEKSPKTGSASALPVLDLETVLSPFIKDSPYIMKMNMEESHSMRGDTKIEELGVQPSTKSEHAPDTEFEYRCMDATKPFASNYLFGFSDGSFACSEEFSEEGAELIDLVLCIRCDQQQKLAEFCCGCDLKFKRSFIYPALHS